MCPFEIIIIIIICVCAIIVCVRSSQVNYLACNYHSNLFIQKLGIKGVNAVGENSRSFEPNSIQMYVERCNE